MELLNSAKGGFGNGAREQLRRNRSYSPSTGSQIVRGRHTNRENLAGILRQANRLIAEQSPKIDRITDQIVLASQDADSAIRKAGSLMDHADATVMNVNTTIDQLRDPIQQDLAQLRSTMEQAKSLIGTIQSVVRGNDDNIRETIDNLRIASENLAQLTDHVNHQPWSLVRIRQPKDRKVPK